MHRACLCDGTPAKGADALDHLVRSAGAVRGDHVELAGGGTAVTGTTRTATIFNVIGMLGERSGPVDSEWHRATVIVSQDRLLSPREMDYWTFAVKRLRSDRRRWLGYDGVGSLEVASGNRLDLRTDIRPLSAAALSETFETDYPARPA